MCDQKVIVRLVGVGGSGTRAIKAVNAARIRNVEYIAADVDYKWLCGPDAPTRLQLLSIPSNGLGNESEPVIGRDTASEVREEIEKALDGADLVFVVTGMDNCTDPDSASLFAEIARGVGALTVGIVTTSAAGADMRNPDLTTAGMRRLEEYADSLFVIPSDDELIVDVVSGITDLINIDGMPLMSIDFADIKSILGERGAAGIGVGAASGENRSVEASRKAAASPLLAGYDISTAKGVQCTIVASRNLTIDEITAVRDYFLKIIGKDTNTNFGIILDEGLEGCIKVIAYFTGFTPIDV